MVDGGGYDNPSSSLGQAAGSDLFCKIAAAMGVSLVEHTLHRFRRYFYVPTIVY